MAKAAPISRPISSSAKRQQVFVDIPSAPYHSPTRVSSTSKVAASNGDMKDHLTSRVRTNSGSSLSSLSSAEPNSPAKSHVYVNVPPSPYPISRRNSTVNPISSGSDGSQKENAAPPRDRHARALTVSQGADGISMSRKRKLSNAALQSTSGEHMSKMKKARRELEDHAQISKQEMQASKQDADSVGQASNEFPDGFFYCHQCRRKLDHSKGAHCTFIKRGIKKAKRCGAKYCDSCLLNRYGEELEDIKLSRIVSLPKEERQNYAQDEEYYFKCFRCCDACNCRMCRKAKGLPPTGKLTTLARQTGVKSAAELLKMNPETKGILPKNPEQMTWAGKPEVFVSVPPADKGKTSTAGSKPDHSPPGGKTKPRGRLPKAALPQKPLPKPTWFRVPTALDLPSAEMRINIREFFLRFASILDVGNPLLDGLEEFTSSGGSSLDMDDETKTALVPWVSEPTVKNMVLALLEILSEDEIFVGDEAQAAKEAIREIRTAGGNLTRLWTALATLRGALHPDTGKNIVDPLPPPANVVFRTTRNAAKGKQTEGTIHVAISAQLIPVVASLVHWSLGASVIKDSLEQSSVQEKEIVKNGREAVARENARWKDLRGRSNAKDKFDIKAERQLHKQQLQDLESAQRVALDTCMPRYSPLGQDHEGRLYYSLSSGAAERDAALRLLAGEDAELKVVRRRGGMTNDERKDMAHWSWFVAVWGKLPAGASKGQPNDEGEDEDEGGQGWWGFYEPEEIRRLAGWITAECALEAANILSISRRRSRKIMDLAASSDASGIADLSSLSNFGSDDEDESGHVNSDQSANPLSLQQTGTPNNRQLTVLVNNLKEYADLLQWRVERVLGADGSEGEKGQRGAVPAKKFYAS